MVNAGRRSKCCFTCRERRVKCDLQKPCCQRCTQAKRVCPGYPTAWNIVLRLQNDYAENKVKARVRKVQTRRMEQARQLTVTIPREIYITAEMHSWNRFCQDYISHSGIAIFSVLPQFYSRSKALCFQEALQAVTLASSARQLHRSELMMQARRHYGKAITALNVALSDFTLTADDSVLVTLFLLSLFEMIVTDFPTSNLKDAYFQCHPHLRGALLLLRWRAEQARISELDNRCFKFFSHIYLMSMFLNNEPFDVKWLALEKFAGSWMKSPLLEPILDRTVRFKRRVIAQVSMGRQPFQPEIIQLIKDGIAISEDLDVVASSIKASLNPDLPSHQQPKAFNGMFEVSTKATEAIARSLYQSVRYHVFELISSLIALFEQDDETHYASSYQFSILMRSMILEEICEEISAVVGVSEHITGENQTGMAYRAYAMFWPLIVLLFSSHVGTEKMMWIQKKLRLLGERSGLGLAVLAASIVDKP